MANDDLKAQMERIRKDLQALGKDKAGRAIKNAAAYMLKTIQHYPLKSTRQDDPRRQATSSLYKPASRENWVDFPSGERTTVAEFLRERLGAREDKKGRLNGFQKSESNRKKVENFRGRKTRTIYTIGKAPHAEIPQPVTYFRISGKDKPRTWSAGQRGLFNYWLRKSWQYKLWDNGVEFLLRGEQLGGKDDSEFLHRLDQGGKFTLPERTVGYKAFIKTTHQGKLIHKEVYFYPQADEHPKSVSTSGFHIAQNIIRIVKEHFHLK